jgi:hypothetical protein
MSHNKHKLRRLHSHKPRLAPHRTRHRRKLAEYMALPIEDRGAFFGSEFDLGVYRNKDIDVINAVEAHLPPIPHTPGTAMSKLFQTTEEVAGFLAAVAGDLAGEGYTVNYPKPDQYYAIDILKLTVAQTEQAIIACTH